MHVLTSVYYPITNYRTIVVTLLLSNLDWQFMSPQHIFLLLGLCSWRYVYKSACTNQRINTILYSSYTYWLKVRSSYNLTYYEHYEFAPSIMWWELYVRSRPPLSHLPYPPTPPHTHTHARYILTYIDCRLPPCSLLLFCVPPQGQLCTPQLLAMILSWYCVNNTHTHTHTH